MKLIGSAIVVVLALIALTASSIALAMGIALLAAPLTLMTWNLGLVPAAAALGASVVKIGFWTAWGIGLVLMTLRTIFSSKGNLGQEIREAVEKQQAKKQFKPPLARR